MSVCIKTLVKFPPVSVTTGQLLCVVVVVWFGGGRGTSIASLGKKNSQHCHRHTTHYLLSIYRYDALVLAFAI